MNQLEALKALTEFQSKLMKRITIHDWLEDINWHSEARMIYENANEYELNTWQKLSRMHIVQIEKLYTVEHFNHLSDHYTDEDRIDLEKTRTGGGVYKSCMQPITHQTMYDFQCTQEKYKVFSQIWGWGLDESLSIYRKEELVKVLEEIINS